MPRRSIAKFWRMLLRPESICFINLKMTYLFTFIWAAMDRFAWALFLHHRHADW